MCWRSFLVDCVPQARAFLGQWFVVRRRHYSRPSSQLRWARGWWKAAGSLFDREREVDLAVIMTMISPRITIQRFISGAQSIHARLCRFQIILPLVERRTKTQKLILGEAWSHSTGEPSDDGQGSGKAEPTLAFSNLTSDVLEVLMSSTINQSGRLCVKDPDCPAFN